MSPNPQETTDLVTFTEEILKGKLDFLCSEIFKSKFNLIPFKRIIMLNHYLKVLPKLFSVANIPLRLYKKVKMLFHRVYPFREMA